MLADKTRIPRAHNTTGGRRENAKIHKHDFIRKVKLRPVCVSARELKHMHMHRAGEEHLCRSLCQDPWAKDGRSPRQLRQTPQRSVPFIHQHVHHALKHMVMCGCRCIPCIITFCVYIVQDKNTIQGMCMCICMCMCNCMCMCMRVPPKI